jgi:protein O-GlcNAc transferase
MTGISELSTSRRLAALAPSDAAVQQRLGIALAGATGHRAAVAPLQRAALLSAHAPEHQINLGIVLLELKRAQQAGIAFRRALGSLPSDSDALHGIGMVHNDLRRFGDAEKFLRRSLTTAPGRVTTLIKLAGALVRLRRIDEAEAVERKALALGPGMAEAHVDLSAILVQQEQNLTALGWCFRACAVDARSVQALVNAGGILSVLGQTSAAFAMLRRAADIDGTGAGPFRNALAIMSYMPVDQSTRWATAREFARRYAPVRPQPDFINARDARRRLTVGYLSSDFYDHPVSRNLVPVLEAHDREQLRIICYSDVENGDGMTQRLRAASDIWRRTSGLGDAEVARLIRDDIVDVLVILGGRLDKNRPLVAAHRAAPVQVSMYDVGTSGLDDMDYLLADRTLVSPMAQRTERFAERVIRLPSFYVHGPILGVPTVSELPCLSAGHVTFGCFNSPVKLSDETLDFWSRLMRELPSARLRLKFMERYRDKDLRRRILSKLDVDPGRVDFLHGDHAIDAHLGNYQAIDIALDTFPFTGCTTTFEALWMGVPVVTLLGDTLVSRLSASFLKPIGLDALIATTPGDYIRIARGLADDPVRLAAIRATLRDRLMRSPICDGRARARQVERVYRAVWQRWCRGS